MRRTDALWVGAVVICAGCMGVLATRPTWLLAGVGVLLGVAVLMTCALRPRAASVILLLLAVPFFRPFVAGERYAIVGVGLAGTAALLALVDNRRVTFDQSTRAFSLWFGLLWLWFTVQTAWGAQDFDSVMRGWLTVWLTLMCSAVVLSDHARRRMFTKALTAVALALCASFVVTFVLWEAAGFGRFLMTVLPIGYKTTTTGADAVTPVYFPLTPTYSSFHIGGLTVPRMLGIGRESGVMAVLIGWCLFTVARIGWARWWVYGLLILGLAGTQSTAGFGVLVVVAVLHRLFLPRREGFWSTGVRRAFGVVVLGGALWAAYYAPVYGFQAKSGLNELSVSDRQQATMTGLRSILDFPFGRDAGLGEVTGINLIGAITVVGVVGLVLIALAMLRPIVLSSDRSRGVSAVLFVFFSVVAAQPPQFSPGFYLLTLLAALPLAEGSLGDGDVGELHSAARAEQPQVAGADGQRLGR